MVRAGFSTWLPWQLPPGLVGLTAGCVGQLTETQPWVQHLFMDAFPTGALALDLASWTPTTKKLCCNLPFSDVAFALGVANHVWNLTGLGWRVAQEDVLGVSEMECDIKLDCLSDWFEGCIRCMGKHRSRVFQMGHGNVTLGSRSGTCPFLCGVVPLCCPSCHKLVNFAPPGSSTTLVLPWSQLTTDWNLWNKGQVNLFPLKSS